MRKSQASWGLGGGLAGLGWVGGWIGIVVVSRVWERRGECMVLLSTARGMGEVLIDGLFD